MCSIMKYKNCVGRNYDYEQSYKEEIRIITPNEFDNKYKIIGMVTGFVKEYPLLYDGMNSEGLVIGGLAFNGNSKYNNPQKGMVNIPSFKFPLWILGNFKTVNEIKEMLSSKKLNITDEEYSEEFPPSDLHWFVSDKNESIIIEQTITGVTYYDGEVMTNNPPYPLQIQEYEENEDTIGKPFILKKTDNRYNTRGKETIYLNGDYTSIGRFTRLSYIKSKLEQSNVTEIIQNNELDVIQSFHLLNSVEQVYGLTPVKDKFEYTIYSIVYDMENLRVHWKKYDSLGYFRMRLMVS